MMGRLVLWGRVGTGGLGFGRRVGIIGGFVLRGRVGLTLGFEGKGIGGLVFGGIV